MRRVAGASADRSGGAELVWYVAYGSNLASGRFRSYLAGGRPTGGRRVYPGCRDPREPAQVAAVEVPGGLVFSGESAVWGGGRAYYDLAAPGVVAGRAYLLTAEQLGDVAAQEMYREPGSAFARELAGVLGEVESVRVMGPGRYETVARVGERDGVPMFTVTDVDAGDLEPSAPSAAYLWWIAAGLRESHGWDAARVAEYLSEARGVEGAWSRNELAEIASAEGPATGGHAPGARSGTAD
ncbi:histone deacetylase [Kribbella sp. DT2]|uniref:histone deacetylase n=1 Tax=Kribbella sp. DT2 TaxID=3393427 RepID=UPI003CE8767C